MMVLLLLTYAVLTGKYRQIFHVIFNGVMGFALKYPWFILGRAAMQKKLSVHNILRKHSQ